MSYPWPVEAVVSSDHYITAIGPSGNGTAVACRCGWFVAVIGSERMVERVRRHMEEGR